MSSSVNQVLVQMQRWSGGQTTTLSDTALLERFVQQRDEAAFAALVSRYGSMVLHVCRRVLGTIPETDDAFQAAFLVLARKASSLRQPEALPGWLHSVARRVALKARGRTNRHFSSASALDESLADPHPDPLGQLSARELLEAVDEEVQRLPSAQRSAVVLCCFEGHSREEAAQRLGWTPASVKNHLQRGRRRLQERLQRRGIALSSALAVVAVSRGEAASRLLLRSTVQAALRGGMDSSATALAQGVLEQMVFIKSTGMSALVLTLALAASATAALVYRGSTPEVLDDKAPATAASREAKPHESEQRTDAHGDRLPTGSVARLGTMRFRHGGHIERVSFAPDGKSLLTLGDDGSRLWEVATGKELRYLPHGAVGRQVGGDLSPDGKTIAVSRNLPANGPIDLWDVASGKLVDSLGEKHGPLVRFSPDGKLLAACTPADVEIWDLASRKKLRSWKAHQFQVWTIAFGADSLELLTIGTEGTVRLWDTANGQQLREITPIGWQPNTIGQVPAAALSPDGKLVAMIEQNEKIKPGAYEARISLIEAATGKRLRQLSVPSKELSPGYARAFGALAFSADGKQIVTGGPDDFLRTWDTATGEESHRLPFDLGWVSALGLSGDGRTAAVVVSGGGAVSIVDMASGKLKTASRVHRTEVQLAALTSDGRTAITSSYDTGALVWDVATGRARLLEGSDTVEHSLGAVLHSLYLSPDGRTLFTGNWDKTVRVWDLATGKAIRQFEASLPNTGIGSFYLSADLKKVVVVDSTQTFRLLDAATGKESQHFRAPEWILGWALTPDGRSLVGWSGDRKVRVWDAASGKLLNEYPLPKSSSDDTPTLAVGNPTPSLFKATLSPDGRLLAVGSEEHPISSGKPKHFLLLLELATGREVLRLENVSSSPRSICFSPDGRMLAWGAAGEASEYWFSGELRARLDRADGAVHLVETATGRERRRLEGHRGFISALAFSANGQHLLSGSVDTTALVWELGIRPATTPLTTSELEALWADLAGADVARAYEAIRKLAGSAEVSVPFLRKQLRPVAAVDSKRLARLIANLESDDFALREKTTAELEKLGDQALPAYRKALENRPALETRRRLEDLRQKAVTAWWDVSGERLRSLRAVEVLELAGTSEARQVLEALAGGAAEVRLTEQAKVALERLAQKASK